MDFLSRTVTVVNPLDGSLLSVHVHALPFALDVFHVAERVRDSTR